ncbi:hypothetical protein HK097_008721, partial [Rhizophlyctis rosea]
ISRDDYHRSQSTSLSRPTNPGLTEPRSHQNTSSSTSNLPRGRSWSESFLGVAKVEPKDGESKLRKDRSKSETHLRIGRRKGRKDIKSAVAKGKIVIGGPVEGSFRHCQHVGATEAKSGSVHISPAVPPPSALAVETGESSTG